MAFYQTRQPELFTGHKSIPINALPEEAWTVINGRSGDDADGLDSLRHKVAVLSRCINIRADSLAAVPWSIMTMDETELWNSEDQQPPPALEWAKNIKLMLTLTEASMCLKSRAFWHVERTLGKKIVGLKWLSPLSVKPIWDKELGLIRFDRTLTPNDIRELKIEDVVHIWIPDPFKETEPDGSPAEAALQAAQVLFSVDNFISGFFNRGAIKATLLTIEGNPSPQEKSRLKAWWDRAFRGVGNAWGTEVVSTAVKPVNVGEGLAELSNTELTNEKRQEIAIAFGIPNSMLFANAANYATSKQDKRNFYDETIIPELDLIEPVLNDKLFNPLGFRFGFRHEDMDIYQEDENERSSALGKLVAAGYPIEVASEILGIELPHGMTYDELAAIVKPPQLTAAGNPTSSAFGAPDQNAPAAKPKSPNEPADGKALDLDRWRRKAEKRVAGGKSAVCAFESAFITEAESQAILGALATATDKRGVSKAFLSVTGFPAWLDGRVGVKSWSLGDYDGPELTPEHRAKLFSQWYGDSFLYVSGLDDFGSELKAAVPLSLDPLDPESTDERKAVARVESTATTGLATAFESAQGEIAKGNERRLDSDPLRVDMGQLMAAPDRVGAVHKTKVADALKAALVAGVDLGTRVSVDHLATLQMGFDWTLPNLVARDWAMGHAAETMTGITATSVAATRQAIARWVENGEPLRSLVRELDHFFGRKRAELVASTEVTAAYANGSREVYRASGVVGKMEWNTANDELVCPVCGPLHTTQVDLEKGFDFPNGLQPAHPRCRCMVLPVVDRGLIRKQILEGQTPLTATQVAANINTQTTPAAQTPIQPAAPKPKRVPKAKPTSTPVSQPQNPAAGTNAITAFDDPAKEFASRMQGLRAWREDQEQVISESYHTAVKDYEREKKAANSNFAQEQAREKYSHSIRQIELKREEIKASVNAKAREFLKAPTPNDFAVSAPKGLNKDKIPDFNRAIKFFNDTVDKSMVPERAVKFEISDRDRSFYRRQDLTIGHPKNLSRGSVSTVHEMGHWVQESRASAKISAAEYHKKRTKGESEQDLGFGTGETAKFDKFINPYTGKGNGVEMLSTGIEYLWDDPVGFANRDPGHFNWTIKTLHGLSTRESL